MRSNKKNKKIKGFSLAEVLTISAVFFIVMVVSLTILIRGWQIIGKVGSSIDQLRSVRETLTRVNMILREADSIVSIEARRIVFTKNSEDLLNPAKEYCELRLDDKNKTIILSKLTNQYPNRREVISEKIIGKNISSIGFTQVPVLRGVEAPSSELIQMDITGLSNNIKIPSINLSTKVKMK